VLFDSFALQTINHLPIRQKTFATYHSVLRLDDRVARSRCWSNRRQYTKAQRSNCYKRDALESCLCRHLFPFD
jgi:hypothetical protein